MTETFFSDQNIDKAELVPNHNTVSVI